MLHMAYILVASPVRRSPRDSSLFSSWRLKLGMGKDLLQLCQDLKGCRAAYAGSMNLAVSCIIDVMGSVIICNIWELWSFIEHYEHNVPICSTTQWRAGLTFARRQERWDWAAGRLHFGMTHLISFGGIDRRRPKNKVGQRTQKQDGTARLFFFKILWCRQLCCARNRRKIFTETSSALMVSGATIHHSMLCQLRLHSSSRYFC